MSWKNYKEMPMKSSTEDEATRSAIDLFILLWLFS